MYILEFWKTWPPVYKRLWWIIILVFLGSLGFAIVSIVQQPGPVLTWQHLQDLQRQEIPVYNVEVANIDLPVQTENYVVFERWLGNPLQLNAVFIDLYLFSFLAGIVIILSTITVLPRLWFLIAAGMAVFMIASFQFEVLEIFGLMNKVPTIGVMVLVMGLALYFQFINKSASFATRIITFTAVIIVIGAVISNSSASHHPLRYFAINTLPAALILIMIFIILVSHEIMASFVSLVGNGTKNSKSLRHYLIISLVYLVNLWLVYFDRINYIEWSYTVSPTFLLIASGILSLWGIRQREPRYEEIFPANPFGVFLMASLGIITLATIGYFISSSNDVVMLSLNDLILYAHIGFGMIFLLYVISNFLPMLQNNFQVYRVLYKPTVMPYFSYRMGGLVFTLALLFYGNWVVPKNHFISGYNTALGDLFVFEGDLQLAEGYYNRAYLFAPYNQHAAMALAELNPSGHKKYLKDANSFRPTEFTLLSGAYGYSNNLEQLILLEEADKALPASGIIKNNLGLAYSKLGVEDRAFKYFLEASQTKEVEASAQMNLLGLLAIRNVTINPDSINDLTKSAETQIRSNALAIANHQGTIVEASIELPKDSLLDLFSASMIGNYITNHLNQPDTTFLATCISIAHKKENAAYRDIILIPASRACYASGRVNKAFELLEEVVFISLNKDLHNTTLALWSLDQGKATVAMKYLQYGMSNKIAQTSLVNAVAVAETGKMNEAIVAWDTLRSSKDSLVRSLSESMTRVLAGPPAWYHDFTEKEKYLYLRYRISPDDSIQFSVLLNQITDEDLKAKAILDRSKKLFDLDEISQAARVYNKLQGLHLTDMQLFSKIKFFELRLFAAQNFLPLVEEQIKKGIVFGPYREIENSYYSALRSLAAGDSVQAAKDFKWLAHNNYYFDEGVVAAAAFFEKYGTDRQEPYTILSEAIQVNTASVKILKAYIVLARSKGYDDYALGASQTLQTLLSPTAFKKFVIENQLSDLRQQ
ncbi:hypothetical protein BH09BAC3_BH09BAC3_18330 [soil metagenome]